MKCFECQINTDYGFFDLETEGKQEVGNIYPDLCHFHNEIFEVEE